jgi:hypothetical protein
MALGSDDAVVISGMASSGIDFGGGPVVGASGRLAFGAKFDGSGKHVWSKGLGATPWASLTHRDATDTMEATSGNAIVSVDPSGSATPTRPLPSTPINLTTFVPVGMTGTLVGGSFDQPVVLHGKTYTPANMNLDGFLVYDP